MTQPPFSGNDFFDQIDSVARNLTGNAFRLKKNDPTAPQKFTEFVAQSEQEFNAPSPLGIQAQPQAAQPQSFTDFEQGGFVSPEVAEARLQHPDWVASQTQPTFADRPVAEQIQTPSEGTGFRLPWWPETEVAAPLAEGEQGEIQWGVHRPESRYFQFRKEDRPESTNLIGQTVGKVIGPVAAEVGRGTGAFGRWLGEAFEQQAYGSGGGGAMARQYLLEDQPSRNLLDRFFAENPIAKGTLGLARDAFPIREMPYDIAFKEARNNGMSMTDSFEIARQYSKQFDIGDEKTGYHGVSGFVKALGNTLRGDLGITDEYVREGGTRKPMFTVGLADVTSEIVNPMTVLPGVGELGLIKAAASPVVRGTKAAVGTAFKAGDSYAAAVGRAAPNVLDPVPPQTVAGRAAGGAGDVPVGAENLPPQPAGTTRLYRIEPNEFRVRTPEQEASWRKALGEDIYLQSVDEKGRLFADDLSILGDYGHGAKGNTSYYIDVPNDVAEASKRTALRGNNPEDAFTEYALPAEFVAEKKAFPSPQQAPPTPATGTAAARQVTPQQQAIIDDVGTGALPADDVAVEIKRIEDEIQQNNAEIKRIQGGVEEVPTTPRSRTEVTIDGQTRVFEDGAEVVETTAAPVARQVDEVAGEIPFINLDATLPSALKRSSPRYGFGQKNFALEWESDVDKALYIVNPSSSKKSVGHDQFMDFLRDEVGLSDSEIRTQALAVRNRIKEIARSSTDDSIRVPSLRQASPQAPVAQVAQDLPVIQQPPVLAGDAAPSSARPIGTEEADNFARKANEETFVKNIEARIASGQITEAEGARQYGAGEYIEPGTNKVVKGTQPLEDRVFEAKEVEVVEEYRSRFNDGLVIKLTPNLLNTRRFHNAIEGVKRALDKLPYVTLDQTDIYGLAVDQVTRYGTDEIGSAVNVLKNLIKGQLEKAFVFERSAKGNFRVTNLKNIPANVLDPRPTISDMARKYGDYWPYLNDEQRKAMAYIRDRAEGISNDMDNLGVPPDKKSLGKPYTDPSTGVVVEDSRPFFISRQETLKEATEKAKGVSEGGTQRSKTSAEAGQVYPSQAAGIEAGEEYLPVWDAMGEWLGDTMETVKDKLAWDFLLAQTDAVTGKPLVTTAAERKSLDLARRVDRERSAISGLLGQLKGQAARIGERQSSYRMALSSADRYAVEAAGAVEKLEKVKNLKQLNVQIRKIKLNADKIIKRLETEEAKALSKEELANAKSEVILEYAVRIADFEEAEKALLASAAQRFESITLEGVSSSSVTAAAKRELADLDRSVKRIENLRETADNAFTTAANREIELTGRAATAKETREITERVMKEVQSPKNLDTKLAKAKEEAKLVERESQRRLKEAGGKGISLKVARENHEATKINLAKRRANLDNLAGEIKADAERVRKGDYGEESISAFRTASATAKLNKITSQTIKRGIQSRKKTSGAAGQAINVVSSYQSVRRQVGATLDDSAVGIQGNMNQMDSPKQVWLAWRDHIQSMFGRGGEGAGKFRQRNAMTDNVIKFNAESADKGAPLAEEIIDKMGIRFGGQNTEVTIDAAKWGEKGLASSIGNLPLVRRANEAFGSFGDVLRLRKGRSEIMEYMRMSGKTFDELVADGTARQIGKSVNGLTGYVPNGIAGAFGDAILFAPKFFQARIEHIAKGTMGMDVDFMIDALPYQERIRQNLGLRGIRNNKNADQLIARRALVRWAAWGTLITVSLNEVLGQPTDFRLMKNGRMNPNFLTVRLSKIGADRDLNFFGPTRSIVGMMLATGNMAWERNADGTSNAYNAYRNIVSPLFGDILTTADIVNHGETRFGETLPEYLISSHMPFSTQEFPNITQDVVKSGGDPKATFGAALTTVLELTGTGSSPLSRSDIMDERVRSLFSTGNLSADNYDDLEPYEKSDVKDSLVSELEEFQADSAKTGTPFKRFFANRDSIRNQINNKLNEALAFYAAGKRSDGSKYDKWDFLDAYFGVLDEERNRLKEAEENLGVEFTETIPDPSDLEAVALQAWFDAVEKSLTVNGTLLPDKLEKLRNKVLADYPAQRQYILRNTNDRQLPAGMIEALTRAGAKKTVKNIRASEVARLNAGGPPRPVATIEAATGKASPDVYTPQPRRVPVSTPTAEDRRWKLPVYGVPSDK